MKSNQAATTVVTVMLMAGLGVGGYFAYTSYTRKHPKTSAGSAPSVPAPSPYAPAPYVPTEQLGIKPIAVNSPALAPQLAPTVDTVMAQMQAQWDAKLVQQQAQLEAQYQLDLARQSNAREAEMLKLQRESAAREAELMQRQQEELKRQNELIQQAEQSRQRELETLRRQEETRKATEAARFQDRVTALNGELRGVQDQIKLVETRLNTLNTSQPDPAFLESVRAMLERQCRQHYGIFGIGCENPKQHEMDARVPLEWEKKKATDRAPLTTELSGLREREKAVLAELNSLGSASSSSQTALRDTPNNLSSIIAQLSGQSQAVARPLPA